MSALELAGNLQGVGVGELIVLDLARVGSGEGVDFVLLEQLLKKVNMRVLVGGGIRDLADLVKLKELGVHGALVATALHSGKITMNELREMA